MDYRFVLTSNHSALFDCVTLKGWIIQKWPLLTLNNFNAAKDQIVAKQPPEPAEFEFGPRLEAQHLGGIRLIISSLFYFSNKKS